MTDHLQKHTDDRDGRLSLHADQLGTIVVATSKPSPSSLVGSGKRTGSIVTVPTSRLLAMIDTIDPDALRAYLRERSDLIDAPDPIDAVPEADSPEDVDESPEHVITVTPEALDAAEQLGRYVRAIGDAYRRGLSR